jgi:hypothetical protein
MIRELGMVGMRYFGGVTIQGKAPFACFFELTLKYTAKYMPRILIGPVGGRYLINFHT